jgi:hypothetical protein
MLLPVAALNIAGLVAANADTLVSRCLNPGNPDYEPANCLLGDTAPLLPLNNENGTGSFINGQATAPPPETLSIYNYFEIDPFSAPYGWEVSGFGANFYIDDTLIQSPSISNVFWSVNKGMSTGSLGDSVKNGTTPATFTRIADPSPDYPLYAITTSVTPFTLVDTSTIDPIAYWLTITPILDSAIDINSGAPPVIKLAWAGSLPNAFLYGANFTNGYDFLNYNYVSVQSIYTESINFSIAIEGVVNGECSSPNPPASCTDPNNYPAVYKISHYPDSCVQPPPDSPLCTGSSPLPICSRGTSIPAPTTTALLSVGLASLGLYHRRRRNYSK